MKNNLMMIEYKEQAVVSSRVVADRFGKQHQHVTQTIENLISENSLVKPMFIEGVYGTKRGRAYKEYLITRDGFTLLVMGFTGKEALEWKLKYIAAFNEMEIIIRERQTTEWITMREQGKLMRRNEMAAIERLIPYAMAQGSKSMDKWAYKNYEGLLNDFIKIESGQRSNVSSEKLSIIILLVSMIEKTILEEMEKGTHYREIYKKCKSNGEEIMRLIGLPRLSA